MREYEVQSSNIKKVSYDNNSKKLIVTFTGDSSYCYENVDPETVCNLMFSKSIGKDFADSIKKKFDFKRV